MKHDCTIIDVIGDVVTIKVGQVYIVGFVNSGVSKNIGDEVQGDILLYGDLKICKSNINESAIIRNGDMLSYSLYGILDIDNCILKSDIEFSIDKEELYDYGYLDGEWVRIDVIRIDIDFDCR